jgi:hypothetical protein
MKLDPECVHKLELVQVVLGPLENGFFDETAIENLPI